MCFSATASFGASAIILAIGIVSLRESSTVPQKTLSCIPLIFAVQQFTEGILWLSLSHSGFSYWNDIASYTFLVFAQVVWPVMVPLSILLQETKENRKNILKVLLVTGVIVSFVLGYFLLFYKVQASISCSHIVYDVSYPVHLKYFNILYFAATVIPPLISSTKRLRLLGLVILVSFAVAKIFYEDYLISVWCYFAAIISLVVLSVIIKLNQNGNRLSKT